MMIEITFKEVLYMGGKSLGTYQFPCVPRAGETVDLGVETFCNKVIHIDYTKVADSIKIVVILCT